MTYRQYREQLGIELSNSRAGHPTQWMIEQCYDENNKDMGWRSYLKKYGHSEETRKIQNYMNEHQCGQDAALEGIKPKLNQMELQTLTTNQTKEKYVSV